MPMTRFSGMVVILALAAPAVRAQAPPPAPAFEVASIKPASMPTAAQIASGQAHLGMNVDAARVDIGSLSLAELIRIAYSVKPYQIQGPDWMSAERFDVVAKLPEGASKEQVPQMLQALLAERFQLKAHRETKEHSVYALVVGKNGPKLKEAPPDTDAPAGAPPPAGSLAIGAGQNQLRLSGNPGDPKGMAISGGPTGNAHLSVGPNGAIHLEIARMTLPAFADFVGRFVDRPVVDMTEMKGDYQMALDLSTQDLLVAARAVGVAVAVRAGAGDAARQPADAASDPSGGSIFAAVQQLGLKLDSRKLPIDLIVIDQVQKTPTEN
jgi:uncharacterized protein (TIGR03435 family)